METVKIFTSGKMSGLSEEEQRTWRRKIQDEIELRFTFTKSPYQLIFEHPTDKYSTAHSETLSELESAKYEKEAMIWDLTQIADSNIIIVNLKDITTSIGTLMELGYIKALNENTNKHIYVLGLGKTNNSHPWLEDVLFHTEETEQDLAEFIINMLLS